MPLPFDPTGSDLKSVHGPAAFVELCGRMQAIELSQPEATRPNNVSISSDLEANTTTVTLTLPITTALNVAGRPEDVATAYMVAPFVPGTSDLVSDTYPEAALELAFILNAYEAAQPEAERPDRIQISRAEGSAAITFTTPVVVTFDLTGRVVLQATDYA
jgi:hypothetical protein